MARPFFWARVVLPVRQRSRRSRSSAPAGPAFISPRAARGNELLPRRPAVSSSSSFALKASRLSPGASRRRIKNSPGRVAALPEMPLLGGVQQSDERAPGRWKCLDWEVGPFERNRFCWSARARPVSSVKFESSPQDIQPVRFSRQGNVVHCPRRPPRRVPARSEPTRNAEPVLSPNRGKRRSFG